MTQMSVTAILAVGMLMVIVSGNIDLSVGSVLGFAGGLAAYSLTTLEYGLPVSIMLAIVVGVLIGFFHKTLTAYLNIPAFIVTLGGLLAWRGATKWLLGGNTIPVSNETFKAIGQGNVPQNLGWILALLAVAVIIALNIRKVYQERAYGLSVESDARNIPIILIGLISALVGLVSFALPWLGVTILTNDIFDVSGYRFATGLSVAGIPGLGGSPVYWLFPLSLLGVCLGAAAGYVNEKFRAVSVYSMVIGGAVSTLLIVYLLIGESDYLSDYLITYKVGLFIAFLSSLVVLGAGLKGVFLNRQLENHGLGISISSF